MAGNAQMNFLCGDYVSYIVTARRQFPPATTLWSQRGEPVAVLLDVTLCKPENLLSVVASQNERPTQLAQPRRVDLIFLVSGFA
jgi:hypothetical protein